MPSEQIKNAYSQCLQQARSHYENFPTASLLVAKSHRLATAAIYSFARRADDFADEGDYVDRTRLQHLQQFSAYLQDIEQHRHIDDTTFIALTDTIQRYQLPLEPFHKLLHAFSMDVTKHRFASFDEVLYYCRHSANPIGELVLRIHGLYNARTATLSDDICTALQLINFMQDIDEDYQQRDRIYIPQNEMQQAGISESVLASQQSSAELKELINDQLVRAKMMLLRGAPLVQHLHGRLKWVIKLTINGGLLVCRKCQQRNNVFTRPQLSNFDMIRLLTKSIYFRPS